MKKLRGIARVSTPESYYQRMTKEQIKRALVSAMESELDEMIELKDLSFECVMDPETGPAVHIYLPFKLIIGEQEKTFNLGSFTRLTQSEIVEYSQGNPGALMILMDAQYNDRLSEGIKYHDLKGDKLYALFNDSCDREMHLFLHLLELNQETVQELIDIYEKNGRGRKIDFGFINSRPSRKIEI